jgi:hypothetical protein
MGHYVPVPSDTGWTDGDLEDQYITSRYRVEAAEELVSENVKEMSNPTRDGRAMIAAGMLHPDGAPKTGAASPPHVTIGAVHVSNRPVGSPGRLSGE